MIPLATACPGCGTAFRVGQDALDAADGLVRCGACNAVFDARAHAVNPVGATPAAAERSIDEEYIQGLILGEPPEPVAASEPDLDAAPETPATAAGMPDTIPPLLATPATAMPRMPVELAVRHGLDDGQRRRVLAWCAGLSVAALLITAQQIWLGRERHAQDPALRPRYERLCAVLGCELPPFRDLRSIRSDGLLVRPDPARPGVLLIDATIANRAKFAQAFPGIRIDFSDIQGKPVTSRVFAPAEYLGAAALREGRMPPGDILKVHIEMPDPGEHATNYELQLTEPASH